MSATSTSRGLSVRDPWRSLWSHTLSDHPGPLTWSPDGGLVAAGSLGGEVVVLDPGSGTVTTKLEEHPGGALSASWAPDGHALAVGGQDGRLSLWVRHGDPVRHLDLGGWVTSVSWSPSGRWVAAASDRTVHVADASGALHRQYQNHPSTVTAVAWEPRGRRVAAAFYGGVRWYEPGRDQDGAVDLLSWKGSVLALAVSADARWLAAGNQDRSVQLWRIGKDAHLEMPGYPSKVDQLAFDHTGRRLAVGSVGFLTVWDCGGRGPEGSKPRLLDGYQRRVSALAWQRQGPILATGSADGLLVMWDPAKSAKPVAVTDLAEEITALSWDREGHAVAVATADGTIQVMQP